MKNLALYTLLLIAQTGLFGQTDKSGCRDHPLITRYPGSLIEYCDTKNYSEFAIATGPETGYRNIDDWQNVTGKHTRIYYSIAGDRTITEIYHNYLSALNKEGFSLLANKQHGERNISKEVGGNTWLGTFYRANPYPTNVGIKMGLGSGTIVGLSLYLLPATTIMKLWCCLM